MVFFFRVIFFEDLFILKRVRCSEEAGEGLWGWVGRLFFELLFFVGFSFSFGFESKLKVGMLYLGFSYLSFSGEFWFSLVFVGVFLVFLGLLGGVGGGILGRVSVFVRRFRLGFLRLSMYDVGV